MVKFRRSYEVTAGQQLRERVDLDDNRAFDGTSLAATATAPRNDVVLVHPVPVRVEVGAMFFHTEQRQVREPYTQQVPYTTTESYDCSTGYGTSRNYRTCTRMVTKYRSETKYRNVTRTVEVSDGSCSDTLRFAPVEGRVYLMQYTYRDNGVCSLACTEQVFKGPGEFDNEPCPMTAPGG